VLRNSCLHGSFRKTFHTAPVSARDPRALVCDDDPVTSRAVEAILRHCGFSVLPTVCSATEGIAAVTRDAPDLVVVDLATAGERGLGTVEMFGQAQPGCRIVVLSAFESLRLPALAAGAYAFLTTSASDLRDLERCLMGVADQLAVASPATPDVTEEGPAQRDQAC
jgi:DNA-binding NarL/FixJ family response regulator